MCRNLRPMPGSARQAVSAARTAPDAVPMLSPVRRMAPDAGRVRARCLGQRRVHPMLEKVTDAGFMSRSSTGAMPHVHPEAGQTQPRGRERPATAAAR
ncbi:MAG TPA: hypothetical protein DCM50_08935 [Stenotrophomonas sp.]|nr:hypothetical protein [Stenotrophomonas sp.]